VGSAGAGSEVAAIVPQHLEREVRAHAVSEDCAHPIDRREALSVVAGTEHEHFRSFGDDRCRDQAQTSLSSDPFTVEIYAVASWYVSGRESVGITVGVALSSSVRSWRAWATRGLSGQSKMMVIALVV
jgi:hypothetical protein